MDESLQGMAQIFFAIYSGLGGLTFEGLQSLSEIEEIYIHFLYTGSFLYTDLVFLSVFTDHANYEIFSRVYIWALNLT